MTDKRKFKITDARGGTALPVRVVSQADKSEIVGVQEGVLKVRLVASSAGDAAGNDELLNLLGNFLGVEPSKFEIIVGHGSNEKLISIEGLTTAEVEDRIATIGQ